MGCKEEIHLGPTTPIFWQGAHAQRQHLPAEKTDFVLSKRSWSGFVWQEPTINKKKIKQEREEKWQSPWEEAS